MPCLSQSGKYEVADWRSKISVNDTSPFLTWPHGEWKFTKKPYITHELKSIFNINRTIYQNIKLSNNLCRMIEISFMFSTSQTHEYLLRYYNIKQFRLWIACSEHTWAHSIWALCEQSSNAYSHTWLCMRYFSELHVFGKYWAHN